VGKKRVFLSFDVANDQIFKSFVLRQVEHGTVPFEVMDFSRPISSPKSAWDARTRRSITRVHKVLLMVGDFTHHAPGVLREVAIAEKAGTPIVQVIGRKSASPEGLLNAGRLYVWTPENIANLLG